MIYQYLTFPHAENGYYSLDQSIMVQKDPGDGAYYFWACQFSIMNGEAAYMGLQTDLETPAGNLHKGVNVAMWGATDAQPIGTGAGMRPNTDGAPGRAIYMPYEWEQGIVYRLRVWQVDSDNNGFWWGFWILNESTGVDTEIGKIYVPLKDFIGNSCINWTEYYGGGNDDPCDSPVRKPESVAFLNPCMNNNAAKPGTQILPVSSAFNHPDCPNYSIAKGSSPYSCIESVNMQ